MKDLEIRCANCGEGLMRCILTDKPIEKVQIMCICGHCGGSSYNINVDRQFFPGAWSDNSHIDVIDSNDGIMVFKALGDKQ